jgi:thioredoxin reductase
MTDTPIGGFAEPGFERVRDAFEQNFAGAILTDAEGRSSEPRVYVIGRSARPGRSQAIISAGDGARAALDILSREAGKDVHDWDTPPKK